jgi:Xaa-Pro dipeptidase
MTNLRNLSFTVVEYRARVRMVQQALAKTHLNALLCHSPASICYLTGFQSIVGSAKYAMALIPLEGDPILLAQDFEIYNALISCWLEAKDRPEYKLYQDPIETTGQLLLERGLGTAILGVETGQFAIARSQLDALTQALPYATFIDAKEIITNLRAIKSEAEIAHIRRASTISSGAMRLILKLAQPGKTDNDLAAAAMEYCVREGGEFFCIEPIISLGSRSGVPHCTFSRNRIQKGDLCFVEIGACIHRYSGPIIRTFSVGEPGATEKRVSDEAQASLNAVIESLGPGISSREIACQARKPWEWTVHQ